MDNLKRVALNTSQFVTVSHKMNANLRVCSFAVSFYEDVKEQINKHLSEAETITYRFRFLKQDRLARPQVETELALSSMGKEY